MYDLTIMILDQQMIWKVMPTQKHAQVLSVQVSCSVVSDSLQPIGLQHTRLLCLSPTPRACSDSCPLSWWYHPTILSSVISFSSCLQSFQTSGTFLRSQESVLHIRWPKYWSLCFCISTSNEYTIFQFLSDWLVWSPFCPRDSQESSPTPQFKSINSLVLRFPYSLTLTSIHDYWINHSFD